MKIFIWDKRGKVSERERLISKGYEIVEERYLTNMKCWYFKVK